MKPSFLSCLVALVCGLLSHVLWAQYSPKDFPIDPSVRTGKLANGMVYYIKANATPKNRVELRLAVNAGSLLEEDDQRGLAHFTEHMAFNGTKNFSKNDVVNLLQKFGVKFGADINAYTSFDETVYQLQLPTDSADILNKGFQILEDWAHNVSFEGEEIDKERGIIIEEWRSRDLNADSRMMSKTLPVLYKGSKYPIREPIGTVEILETFKHERIRKFYKDWYRPDLMAVIVVGDINPEEMEKKVKEQFGKIPASVNPIPRPIFEVPKHDENLIVVTEDKEAMSSTLQLMFKRDASQVSTWADRRKKTAASLFTAMLNSRFNEMRFESNPPFQYAASFDGDSWARAVEAFQVYAGVANDDPLRAVSSIYESFERVRQFGFIAPELDRAKKQVIAALEKSYNERNTTESRIYCYRLVANFLNNKILADPETDFAAMKSLVEGITLEEVNQLVASLMPSTNSVLAITCIQKEGSKMPTEAEVREAIAKTKTLQYKPYEEKAIATNLLASEPKSGKIASLKKGPEGVTEMTLSNGLRVLLKQTEFKQDEIMFSAFSSGGHSLYSDKDFVSAAYAGEMVETTGWGSFSAVNLRKALAGKTAYIGASVDMYEERLYGQSKTMEAKDLFQLIHLAMTSPREDAEAAKNFVQMQLDQVKGYMNSPEVMASIESSQMMSNYHKRVLMLPNEEIMAKFDAQKAIKFYKERFSNAADFTVVFVGKFNEDELKPLIEKYLASLPTLNKAEKFKDLGVRPPKGVTKKELFAGVDEKSSVNLTFHRTEKANQYEMTDYVRLMALSDLMDLRLTEVLREDKGGVYSPYCGMSFERMPLNMSTLTVAFDCSPTNAENLTTTTLSLLESIQKNGASESDLGKVKEGLKREHEANLQQNRYWMRAIERGYRYGKDMSALATYTKLIDALTTKDLQDAAKRFADFSSYTQLTLYPAKYQKK